MEATEINRRLERNENLEPYFWKDPVNTQNENTLKEKNPPLDFEDDQNMKLPTQDRKYDASEEKPGSGQKFRVDPDARREEELQEQKEHQKIEVPLTAQETKPGQDTELTLPSEITVKKFITTTNAPDIAVEDLHFIDGLKTQAILNKEDREQNREPVNQNQSENPEPTRYPFGSADKLVTKEITGKPKGHKTKQEKEMNLTAEHCHDKLKTPDSVEKVPTGKKSDQTKAEDDTDEITTDGENSNDVHIENISTNVKPERSLDEMVADNLRERSTQREHSKVEDEDTACIPDNLRKRKIDENPQKLPHEGPENQRRYEATMKLKNDEIPDPGIKEDRSAQEPKTNAQNETQTSGATRPTTQRPHFAGTETRRVPASVEWLCHLASGMVLDELEKKMLQDGYEKDLVRAVVKLLRDIRDYRVDKIHEKNKKKKVFKNEFGGMLDEFKREGCISTNQDRMDLFTFFEFLQTSKLIQNTTRKSILYFISMRLSSAYHGHLHVP